MVIPDGIDNLVHEIAYCSIVRDTRQADFLLPIPAIRLSRPKRSRPKQADRSKCLSLGRVSKALHLAEAHQDYDPDYEPDIREDEEERPQKVLRCDLPKAKNKDWSGPADLNRRARFALPRSPPSQAS